MTLNHVGSQCSIRYVCSSCGNTVYYAHGMNARKIKGSTPSCEYLFCPWCGQQRSNAVITCPMCGKQHPANHMSRNAVVAIGNKSYEYVEEYCICEEHGEYKTIDIMRSNFLAAEAACRGEEQ